MLRREDQVMSRLLGPVVTGDLPFQLLQVPALFQGASAELREREHCL
ncbi:hypothetical protein [Streptomyces sp. NBC_01092]|nr:hypothetical protein OG254_24960 [Streptomyces sp. NBC_01092]